MTTYHDRRLARQSVATDERYEELRRAAQEAVDARNLAIRGYDCGEPDLPILAMVRLERVLKRHAGRRIAFENPRTP